MNKNELNKIIEKYYSFDDAVMCKLNIDDKQKFDLVLVSPTWKPNFIFDADYNIKNLKLGSTSTYIIKHDGKTILYIKTGKGSPNMVDNLLLLRNIEAPFVFLGSAGSLSKTINEGDILIPDYSISGDGASLYFDKRISNSKLFNKIYFRNEVRNHVENILTDYDYPYVIGGVFSTDSLIGEYYHLDEILGFEVSCIEQETSAFGKCMQIMERDGVPILVISDSMITNQNYYEPLENKKKYLLTRTKKLQKVINKM